MRNSITTGVVQVNKLFGQAPFRSEKVAKIFELLSLGKPMLARELAEVIGVPSKQILPRLKRYILKGWVVTQKVNNINIYSLTETARKILRLQGSNFERVKENAEKLLGRKLEQDELEILRFFFKRQGYVENSPSESIAEQVWHSLGRKIPLSRVQEILTEFTLRGILFAFRLKNGVILKVRLNRDVL